MKLGNYVLGSWKEGNDAGKPLYNAINGEQIALATSAGLNFGDILDYGRTKGGQALRKMTFQERGLMLKALALHLMEIKIM